ncbi:uracil-DNA glycosylase [Rhodoferax sp. GW822-FHT02A01]|uniref:uracil-DNA glycosylase n=1 Tax=Rhodoferax sp. GW822-FHT02A01 TaxID=3141537 RepID=UPI00315CE0BF
MALELDSRQRAMLQEMGVHVWLPESGVVTLQAPQPQTAAPVVQARPAAPVPPPAAPAARVAVEAPVAAPVAAPVQPLGDAATLDWPALAETVRSCQACGLCAGRRHASITPVSDAAPCDWMVVGDPPDEEEDYAGAPFAGQDGVLLSHMLRALGLQRANPLPGHAAVAPAPVVQRAYVSHVLKCRPAHGAIPQAGDLAQCAAYLQREIALVQPKMILAMGRFANQVLLGETPAQATLPLGKLRGSVHRFQGIPVIVTYHPKALMRNGADKAKAWADLCLAADTLDHKLTP